MSQLLAALLMFASTSSSDRRHILHVTSDLRQRRFVMYGLSYRLGLFSQKDVLLFFSKDSFKFHQCFICGM